MRLRSTYRASVLNGQRIAAHVAGCAVALWVLLSPVLAHAQEEPDAQPRLQLNGFGTVGYVSGHVSQPWRFRREVDQAIDPNNSNLGTDSRLGVQANLQVNRRLDFAAQLLQKDRARSSPVSDDLELAFAAFHPTDDVVLRAGRTALDIYQLAECRNVGFAYLWARPNTEFYSWMPLFHLDGADAALRWNSGESTWRLKGFAGQSNSSIAYGPGVQDGKLRGHVFGFSLSRVDGGLTAKLSALRLHAQLRLDPVYDQGLAQLQQLSASPFVPPSVATEAQSLYDLLYIDRFTSNYTAFGLSYDHGPWLLQSEVSHVNGSFAPGNGWYAYASVGYRIGNVTVYSMSGRAMPLKKMPPPPQWGFFQAYGDAATAVIGASRKDQHSESLGMRWDINPSMSLKLQVDHYHTFANGGGLWGNDSPASANANVVSTVLDFMF